MARDERAMKHTVTHGACGYWNNGDGNVPDEGATMVVRVEELPPTKEEAKGEEVWCDTEKSIFGA